jgi:glutaredoxin
MTIFKIFFLSIGLLLITGCTAKPDIQTPLITTLQPSVTIPAGNLYFYSKTCLHCNTVAQYVSNNDIKNKGVHYFDLEVSENKNNAEILRLIGQRCLITEDNLSVPLLWYNQKCISGSDEIINFFTTQLQTN